MNGVAAALACLLVAGHALGDFVFQTDGMIRQKKLWSARLAHVGVVALCHVAALLPLLSGEVLLAVLAIAAAHFLLDSAKVAVSARFPFHDLEWFALDQLGHLAVLAAAWRALAPHARLLQAGGASAHTLAVAGVLVSAYAFNVNGASAIVSALLGRLRLLPHAGGPTAGRVIGILERAFAVTLILLDRWEALGFLVAAKALARFKELERRSMAEYYLVGTLASLLAATATALIARGLIRR